MWPRPSNTGAHCSTPSDVHLSFHFRFDTVTETSAPTATRLHWPTPPYAPYQPDPQADGTPQGCEVEGVNGLTRNCELLQLSPKEGHATVQIPPSNFPLTLRFSMFRRLRLHTPLVPHDTGDVGHATPLQELLTHRPQIAYRLAWSDGQTENGQTVGHLETEHGLFLFEPLGKDGQVRRCFIPRAQYQSVSLGDAIGQVLVQEHSISAEQIERAAQEQENLRNRKLGDYLVTKEIVKPEQLLLALEQQARMPMMRIGEALTALGLISEGQLQQALQRQQQERSVPLGELLVKSGLLTRQKLQIALVRKMGYPVVDLEHFTIDPEALRCVNMGLAQRLKVLPLLRRAGMLVVATEDPSRHAMIDELEFSTQLKVVAALGNTETLPEQIREIYTRFGLDNTLNKHGKTTPNQTSAERADQLLETLEQNDADLDGDSEAQIEQSDNSLVRLINTMIIEAHQQGASDIHIETFASRRKVRIRFRKDGRLAPYMELPPGYRAALVARIKIMCDLDISERRKPQDGKIDFAKYAPPHKLELRVATIPTQGGAEDVVMRLLASGKALKLSQLHLSATNLHALQTVAERPYGMLLCVGPTGSGKTTTLHALLRHLNTPERKIWTAEDPIEISNPDLRQVQVNPKIDWTFAKALRAFLRADPDVIMVGEIRDSETAQMAIEASLTGHLVLSTLHTNSAPETVTRLLDMGMDPFNFADSLLGVLAQRLVRQWCPQCRVSEPASEEYVQGLLNDYLHQFPDDMRPDVNSVRTQWLAQFGHQDQLPHHHAPGCPSCHHTGYKGRIGIHELLLTDTPALRHLIQTRAPSQMLQRESMTSGQFRTLRQDGILKVLAGQTSIEEVRASCA